jgi:hypothetical protein
MIRIVYLHQNSYISVSGFFDKQTVAYRSQQNSSIDFKIIDLRWWECTFVITEIQAYVIKKNFRWGIRKMFGSTTTKHS